MKGININCDVGEGVENEASLMQYISSCNIACGGHFGDERTIDKTIRLAIKNKVLIGAHPSFPDKENFGRKELDISEEALKKSIDSQMRLFVQRLERLNGKFHHIKPHGALYNLISVDRNYAIIFINAIEKYLNNIFLFVPYNSEIEKVALEKHLKIKYEAFADRNYTDDLKLVARNEKYALITEGKKVLKHILLMVEHQKVKTISGAERPIKAATFCVHGDTENALEILKYLSKKIKIEKAVNF